MDPKERCRVLKNRVAAAMDEFGRPESVGDMSTITHASGLVFVRAEEYLRLAELLRLERNRRTIFGRPPKMVSRDNS